MAAREGEPVLTSRTSFERVSDRELVIARTIDGPARIVFDAWTRPELVRRWWAPRSLGVVMASCEADVRLGGGYRYVVRPPQGEEVAFSRRTAARSRSRAASWRRDDPRGAGTRVARAAEGGTAREGFG
jgi:uncharacterized protein YndB with AHSA1/START domain